MNQPELERLLHELLSLPAETEWVEFKHNNSAPEEIGEYLSAIANSAALHGKTRGYVVWGVEDGSHRVLGTTFRPRRQKGAGNEDLEPWLTRLLSPRIDFTIYEFDAAGAAVVMFEVQAANTAPVAFKSGRFVRVGSHKKSLKDHPEKERKLWQLLSGPVQDWSAQVCEGATHADLDPRAVAFARQQYKAKNQGVAAEVDGWDDLTFLNKAKVCIAGRITRTALVLLGREESAHFLSPAVARITWVLQDAGAGEPAYQHFDPPFILSVDAAFAKVRNVTIQSMSGHSLFPAPVSKYDAWVVREALHNCIAHQDYTQAGKINFVEEDDSLLLTNLGHFIPESVEQVIEQDAPPERYRNPFLATAMVNLNMIDTIGSGIRRMFRKQRERSLPMPDYDLGDPQRVRVRIHGKILDEHFTRLLMGRTDLPLADVIALDKVQKRKQIDDGAFRSLKRKGLIEGRRPNLRISATVAAATGQEAEYIHIKGFDKDDCKRKVLDYLRQFGSTRRKMIEKLLWDKLSDALDDEQKRNYVRNLLQEMSKKDKSIQKAEGQTKGVLWELSKPAAESGV